jgi:nitrogen fixation/metabolism regulation signal transduction histidine kinase
LKRPNHERQVLILAFLAGLAPILTVVALLVLWPGDLSGRWRWLIGLAVLGVWLLGLHFLLERVRFPLRTLASLLAAIREGDYSIRAHDPRQDDALGAVLVEVNALGENLREQRLGALEATALLRTVMAEIDLAVFAFDAEERLRLVNRAGERLLGRPIEQLLGRRAADLGLRDNLLGEPNRIATVSFPGGLGRWGIRRSTFRQQGRPHQLLVMTDLSRALRDEERQAWQRIVRVIGHEINNSLAPIKSIAGSLVSLLKRAPRADDWEEDTVRGLGIIGTRAEALSRFMESYTRIAKLPPPRPRSVEVAAWIHRVAGLEARLPVQVGLGPPLVIEADGDQLDQLLINLIRNAVDAVLECPQEGASAGPAPHAPVEVGWTRMGDQLEVSVTDTGPGLAGTANLFTPFFTTKPGGSGIGLILSRQIAEAHGGSLILENRKDARGCVARLRLPWRPPQPGDHHASEAASPGA